MTIEGAIADIQNLIDSDGIPFWAKPSLQKVKETVEAERERYIEERKTGKWQITDAYPHNVYCSKCHKKYAQTHWTVWNDEEEPLPRNYCPNCGAKMEGAEG